MIPARTERTITPEGGDIALNPGEEKTVRLSAVMAAVLLPVTKLGVHDLVKLLIMVPAGAAIYVGGSLLLKLESFSYVLDIAKKLLHRGKENP